MTAPTLQCTAVGCVIRPGHNHTCLPRPARMYLCTRCAGRGRSGVGVGWPCGSCQGIGIAA